MKRKSGRALGATLALGLLGPPGEAATLRVPDDYPTIPAGLSACGSGDTVLVAPGTYTEVEYRGGETSCAFLVGGAWLVSEGGPEVTTIDMQGVYGPSANAVRAGFSDEPMWIEGFTVTGSPLGRAGVQAGQIPKLTIKGCTLRDLDAGSVDGGGVRAFLMDLDVIGCHFLRCHGDHGAGLGLTQCATRVIDSVFEDCEKNAISQLTGDIFVYDESLLVENSRFLGNHAGIGGAILEDVDGDVVIKDCRFEGNTAAQWGGAVFLAGSGGSRVVEGCVFWDNHSLGASGGGVETNLSTEITGCTFSGNSSATSGSAVRARNGSSSLENCIIANSIYRSAISVSGGSLSSTCNVFWNNEAGISFNWIPDPTDFEADPLFCNPDSGNFELSSQSPCLPPASGACGLIGAFGKGCGSVSIEDSSWGRIKGQYIGKNGGGR